MLGLGLGLHCHWLIIIMSYRLHLRPTPPSYPRHTPLPSPHPLSRPLAPHPLTLFTPWPAHQVASSTNTLTSNAYKIASCSSCRLAGRRRLSDQLSHDTSHTPASTPQLKPLPHPLTLPNATTKLYGFFTDISMAMPPSYLILSFYRN